MKIDYSKCLKCMKCVAVCPFTALQEVGGKPELNTGKLCLECLHCAAACPAGAITYKEETAVLQNDLQPLGENFAGELKTHILNRRSYRHFSDEKVPSELIKEALELASWGPSAKNQHTTGWVVIESAEIIKKMMECILQYSKENGVSPEIVSEMAHGNNVVMGESKTLILAYADDNAISPETDTAIAMTTAELYLQSKGVGTCWAGYLKRMANTVDEVKALLPAIPENHSFYGAFMLGWPQNEEYIRVPKRTRKNEIKWV